MTIAKNIDAYCKKAGISEQQMEKVCGLGHGTIRKWRIGRQMPSMRTMAKIEKATGIPIAKWSKEGGVK